MNGLTPEGPILLVTVPDRHHLDQQVALQSELGSVEVCIGPLSEAIARLHRQPFIAVVLDLPQGERVPACAAFRRHTESPILVIGNLEAGDAAVCLDAGADDYVAQAERVQEVAARLRARLRRTRPPSPPPRGY